MNHYISIDDLLQSFFERFDYTPKCPKHHKQLRWPSCFASKGGKARTRATTKKRRREIARYGGLAISEKDAKHSRQTPRRRAA